MPLITFESGQLTPKTKEKLIEQLTDVSAKITGIPKDLFFISIHELPDTDIAVGGKSVKKLKEQLANK